MYNTPNPYLFQHHHPSRSSSPFGEFYLTKKRVIHTQVNKFKLPVEKSYPQETNHE